jgi:hypothetical protein
MDESLTTPGLKGLTLTQEVSKKFEVPESLEMRQSPFSKVMKALEDIEESNEPVPSSRRFFVVPISSNPNLNTPMNRAVLSSQGTSTDIYEKAMNIEDEVILEDKQGDRTLFEDVIETQIDFHFSQFFEFLFYHFMFFFISGPFTYPLLVLCTKKEVLRNQYFWGCNWMFFQQVIQYLLLTISLLLYHSHPSVKNVYLIEIYMLVTSIFLRIVVISLKYGSMDPARVKFIKENDLTIGQNFKEYMLIAWREQTDEIIEEELSNSMARERVDTSMFFFKFFLEPTPHMFDATLRKNPKKFITLFMPYLRKELQNRKMTVGGSRVRLSKIIEECEIDEILRKQDIKSIILIKRNILNFLKMLLAFHSKHYF